MKVADKGVEGPFFPFGMEGPPNDTSYSVAAVFVPVGYYYFAVLFH